MSDWRLNGQEKHLSGAAMYKVDFPLFWETAYREKNAFFREIERAARQHVESAQSGREFLEGEKIRHFWHEHCEFCWEEALTDKACTFYCTADLEHWVCEECFREFRNRFIWREKAGEELPL